VNIHETAVARDKHGDRKRSRFRQLLSLAYPRIGCYNAAMADWRQIQARIRKAKNSADALTKLSELYQRTHDAMVAWELGAVAEKAERNEDAVKWYTIAAERFRRADWKKKAEEALARLGAPIPVAGAKPSPEPVFAAASSSEIEPNHEYSGPSDSEETQPRLALGEIREDSEDYTGDAIEVEVVHLSDATPPTGAGVAEADTNGKKKRRRGRRGGRGRRRKGAPAAAGLPSQAFAESGAAHAPSRAANTSASAYAAISAFAACPAHRNLPTRSGCSCDYAP
jgi:tetratricopeptide (TPR) repeat protein